MIYFYWCHEFLDFLGCGEQSTVECSEHSPHIPGKNCKIQSKLCNLDKAISPIISNLLRKFGSYLLKNRHIKS